MSFLFLSWVLSWAQKKFYNFGARNWFQMLLFISNNYDGSEWVGRKTGPKYNLVCICLFKTRYKVLKERAYVFCEYSFRYEHFCLSFYALFSHIYYILNKLKWTIHCNWKLRAWEQSYSVWLIKKNKDFFTSWIG